MPRDNVVLEGYMQQPTLDQNADYNFFVPSNEIDSHLQTRYDFIVVGSSICAYSFVRRLVLNAHSDLKILVLERGSFELQDHIQCLSPAMSALLGNIGETFPFTRSTEMIQNDPDLYQHGSVNMFGGRSALWTCWSPFPVPRPLRPRVCIYDTSDINNKKLIASTIPDTFGSWSFITNPLTFFKLHHFSIELKDASDRTLQSYIGKSVESCKDEGPYGASLMPFHFFLSSEVEATDGQPSFQINDLRSPPSFSLFSSQSSPSPTSPSSSSSPSPSSSSPTPPISSPTDTPSCPAYNYEAKETLPFCGTFQGRLDYGSKIHPTELRGILPHSVAPTAVTPHTNYHRYSVDPKRHTNMTLQDWWRRVDSCAPAALDYLCATGKSNAAILNPNFSSFTSQLLNQLNKYTGSDLIGSLRDQELIPEHVHNDERMIPNVETHLDYAAAAPIAANRSTESAYGKFTTVAPFLNMIVSLPPGERECYHDEIPIYQKLAKNRDTIVDLELERISALVALREGKGEGEVEGDDVSEDIEGAAGEGYDQSEPQSVSDPTVPTVPATKAPLIDQFRNYQPNFLWVLKETMIDFLTKLIQEAFQNELSDSMRKKLRTSRKIIPEAIIVRDTFTPWWVQYVRAQPWSKTLKNNTAMAWYLYKCICRTFGPPLLNLPFPWSYVGVHIHRSVGRGEGDRSEDMKFDPEVEIGVRECVSLPKISITTMVNACVSKLITNQSDSIGNGTQDNPAQCTGMNVLFGTGPNFKDSDLKVIQVPPTTKVVLGMGMFPAANLLSESFPLDETIGSDVGAHSCGSIVARILKKDAGPALEKLGISFHDSFGDTETDYCEALYLSGHTESRPINSSTVVPNKEGEVGSMCQEEDKGNEQEQEHEKEEAESVALGEFHAQLSVVVPNDVGGAHSISTLTRCLPGGPGSLLSVSDPDYMYFNFSMIGEVLTNRDEQEVNQRLEGQKSQKSQNPIQDQQENNQASTNYTGTHMSQINQIVKTNIIGKEETIGNDPNGQDNPKNQKRPNNQTDQNRTKSNFYRPEHLDTNQGPGFLPTHTRHLDSLQRTLARGRLHLKLSKQDYTTWQKMLQFPAAIMTRLFPLHAPQLPQSPTTPSSSLPSSSSSSSSSHAPTISYWNKAEKRWVDTHKILLGREDEGLSEAKTQDPTPMPVKKKKSARHNRYVDYISTGLVHESSVLHVGDGGSVDPEDYRYRCSTNVHVMGSGLLPTSASWNPSGFLAAMAIDLADVLVVQHKLRAWSEAKIMDMFFGFVHARSSKEAKWTAAQLSAKLSAFKLTTNSSTLLGNLRYHIPRSVKETYLQTFKPDLDRAEKWITNEMIRADLKSSYWATWPMGSILKDSFFNGPVTTHTHRALQGDFEMRCPVYEKVQFRPVFLPNHEHHLVCDMNVKDEKDVKDLVVISCLGGAHLTVSANQELFSPVPVPTSLLGQRLKATVLHPSTGTTVWINVGDYCGKHEEGEDCKGVTLEGEEDQKFSEIPGQDLTTSSNLHPGPNSDPSPVSPLFPSFAERGAIILAFPSDRVTFWDSPSRFLKFGQTIDVVIHTMTVPGYGENPESKEIIYCRYDLADFEPVLLEETAQQFP